MLPIELEPISEVREDGTFHLEPITAAGVAFSPLPGNQGGYPLVLILNDDKKRRHVVRGPQYLPGALQSARLVVDTSEGGGAPGDRWVVTLLSVPHAPPDAFQRLDSDGFLQIRSAGERTLFDFNTAVDFAPFQAAFQHQATGLFYMSPRQPRAFSLFTGSESIAFAAWDLSRFNHAALFIDQAGLSGKGLNWSIEPYVEVTHSEDGRAMSYLPMGSLGQFGNMASQAWAAQPGYIILGANADSAGTHTREHPHMYPRMRFGLLVTSNQHPWEQGRASLESLELRIKGLAW